MPAHLEALLGALEATGNVLSDPNQREGMFPLIIPMCRNEKNGEQIGLLRWPQTDRIHDMPVVSIRDGGVSLLAQDTTQLLHRMLVEEDVDIESGKKSIRAVENAIGYLGSEFYTQGDYARGELPRLAAYITKKVGYFPDVCEELVQNHMEKGDTLSATITVDWYAGRFPHWGSPHVYSAKLYKKLERWEEARDEARKALLKPWWTLGEDWDSVKSLAGFENEDADSLREKIFQLQNQEKLQTQFTNQGTTVIMSEDEAMWMLDREASRGQSADWEGMRSDLAAAFQRSGRVDVAHFVQL